MDLILGAKDSKSLCIRQHSIPLACFVIEVQNAYNISRQQHLMQITRTRLLSKTLSIYLGLS